LKREGIFDNFKFPSPLKKGVDSIPEKELKTRWLLNLFLNLSTASLTSRLAPLNLKVSYPYFDKLSNRAGILF
ncbi:MAG: hypothetical protein WA749_11725, partial [Gelidibacter sp.]